MYLDKHGKPAMGGLGESAINRDRRILQEATSQNKNAQSQFIRGKGGREIIVTPTPTPTPTGGGGSTGGGNTGGRFGGGVIGGSAGRGQNGNSIIGSNPQDKPKAECPDGQEKFNGNCLPKCPDTHYRANGGMCKPKNGGDDDTGEPQRGELIDDSGKCPSGQEKFNGKCVTKCADGYSRNSSGSCVQNECPSGQIRNSITGQCESYGNNIVGDCPSGYYRNSNGGCTENNSGGSNSGSTTGGGGGGGSTTTYSEDQNTNTTGTETIQTKQDTQNSPAPIAPQSDCLWTAFGKCWTWGDVAIAAAVTLAVGGGVYYLMTKQG